MAWGDIRMKFIRFIAFALVFCTFMLCGCSKRDADAYSVLAALVIASQGTSAVLQEVLMCMIPRPDFGRLTNH